MHLLFPARLLALPVLLALATPSQAETWTVDSAQSTLGFEVMQGGNVLKGTFATWTAEIEFDPASPETATISAEVSPASAATGNPQFDTTMPAKDWFDASAFPTATFETGSVALLEDKTYKADGTLSIKGATHPVTLDFTLQIEGDTATATGTATVNRLDYELGAGVGTDTVGNAVTVTLNLKASR